ncbi:MAG: M28 family peptidase [Vicinamibacterales bacterium]
MRTIKRLWVFLGVVAALVICGHFDQADVAGQRGQQQAKSASPPRYIGWPLPAAGTAYGTIDGRHLWQYVKEQADIAERYRDQGHPQFWGRIAGTSSDIEDVQWLMEKYHQIGLTDVHSQTVNFFYPQWAPVSWDVAATADGKTVKLTSAQPPYGAASTDGKVLDLQAVYVGLGSEADFAGRDVRGKAVLFLRGGPISYNMGPADVLKRAGDKGAAAIFGSDLRGGNFNTQSYKAATSVPTFNLGTEDALTIRDLIAKAPADPPHVKIRVDAKWEAGQKSFLVWGTLPGATDETIYVIAHRDGWFDASGDNASGVATILGLAEYFAKVPQSRRRRTMIFIGTDGHHQITPGGYGREWLAANREKFFAKTALMFNAEHPSEVLTHEGTAGWTETTIPDAWYAGGSSRPQLTKIAGDAFHEFGLPIWALPSTNPPGGDLGPFAGFVPGVIAQSNDFIYMHTTGDTPENVAWSGLEAVTRAYARIVDEVNKLPLSDLQRAPAPYRPRIDLSECAAWIKDSSVGCTPKTQ